MSSGLKNVSMKSVLLSIGGLLSIFRSSRPSSVLSSPGLTGRPSNHRPGILDCPVKPGNDTNRVNLIEKCSNSLRTGKITANFRHFRPFRRFPLGSGVHLRSNFRALHMIPCSARNREFPIPEQGIHPPEQGAHPASSGTDSDENRTTHAI